MAGAAGLQNRAGLQQQLLQRGLVTKSAYSPGYQVLRSDGHLQQRGKLSISSAAFFPPLFFISCCQVLWLHCGRKGRDGLCSLIIHVGIINMCLV